MPHKRKFVGRWGEPAHTSLRGAITTQKGVNMIVRMVLELACDSADAFSHAPPEDCAVALTRNIGGRPESADPLIVAMGRGHLIGEAKALGWQNISARHSPSGDELNICPACWAKQGGK